MVPVAAQKASKVSRVAADVGAPPTKAKEKITLPVAAKKQMKRK